MNKEVVDLAQLIVSSVTLICTIAAAILALRSFDRSDQWKRAEFLAAEMKEFFANPKVQTAMLLIDWGTRSIPLFAPTAKDGGHAVVTRAIQVRALLPHPIMNAVAGSDVVDDSMQGYSPAEAAIRDCYDAFLDGLERFASYVDSGLVEASALRPYIGYWIDDIHAPTEYREDAAWCAALLAYIEFYRFDGVQKLFRTLDRSIDPNGEAFGRFLERMADQELAAKLAAAAGRQR